MNYFSLLVIGFVVGLSGAILPGPILFYTISKVLQGRMINGVKIVFGHMLVEVVVIVLILLGLKEIIGSKILSTTLAIIGGLALIVIGIYLISKANHIRLPQNKKEVNFSFGLVAGGMFFTAFNPTFSPWWVTIGALLLSKAVLSGIIGVVTLIVGHWLADLAWYGSVSFAVSKGKHLLDDKRYQAALRILGVTLFAFGVYFLSQVTSSKY